MPRARTKPNATQAAPDSSVRSVAFVSLGCPKNLVDSEKMLGLLAEDGLLPVSAEAEGEADAIVVNTCGFLEASKEESLEVIRDAVRRKQAGEIKRVVVAGCLVQRHRAKMLEWVPGIDAMIGVFDRDHIVDAVRGPTLIERKALREVSDNPRYWIAGNALQAAKARGMNTVGLTVNGKDGSGLGYFESDASRLRLTPRHYAYLRISEGCNQNCAFCTIPSIRGKMRSKPLDAILNEARELLRDGAIELNLIGQDTTSYGDDIGTGFARSSKPTDFDSMGGLPRLLSALNTVVDEELGASGGGWLRLMYAYPSNFADEMVAAIADLPHVLKYIDIPLQHASDAVLERMRRNVTAEAQRRRIATLRDRAPGMAIRTTFITGFPGETEDDHKRLLGFIAETRFDMLGVFEYSREEGTPAGTMDADPALGVPPEVKARRRDEIMSLQQSIAFERNRALAARFNPDKPSTTGARFRVLIDANLSAPKKPSRRRSAAQPAYSSQGRTYFQAPQIDSVTFVHSQGPLEPGAMVECTVVGAEGYDLIAVPSADLE